MSMLALCSNDRNPHMRGHDVQDKQLICCTETADNTRACSSYKEKNYRKKYPIELGINNKISWTILEGYSREMDQ